jgi:hypothetical protein
VWASTDGSGAWAGIVLVICALWALPVSRDHRYCKRIGNELGGDKPPFIRLAPARNVAAIMWLNPTPGASNASSTCHIPQQRAYETCRVAHRSFYLG